MENIAVKEQETSVTTSSRMITQNSVILEANRSYKEEEQVESAPPATKVKTSNKTQTASPYFLRATSKAKNKTETESTLLQETFSLTSPPPSPKRKTKGGQLNCIPYPPLASPSFGLLQEKLARDPFRLIIGVSFLIRTKGRDSIPVFYQLMEKYPTVEALAEAKKSDIVEMTRHLGLQDQRADTYIRYAKTWLTDPPAKGKRYRTENYPYKNAHQGIGKSEVLADDAEDPREGAYEIAHLTKGAYTLDSWRIFCRDVLRGLATSWNGEGAVEGFQPEWMRVLPTDKELMAFCRWCWLREGWEWDAKTGERTVASKELLDACEEGKLVWEWRGNGGMSGNGKWRVLDEPHRKAHKVEASG